VAVAARFAGASCSSAAWSQRGDARVAVACLKVFEGCREQVGGGRAGEVGGGGVEGWKGSTFWGRVGWWRHGTRVGLSSRRDGGLWVER
jgi:hypothetical protein